MTTGRWGLIPPGISERCRTVDERDVANKKFQKELSTGTVALVLLSVLDRAARPMYGYQIAKQMEERDTDLRFVKQGALYPVLRSLENGGLLESRVEPSTSGPPRRYYNITSDGRLTLAAWVEIWNRTRDFVEQTLRGNHDG